MTTGQFLGFAFISTVINRAHCVNDVLRSQPSAGRDDSLSRGQDTNLAHNLTALGEYGGSAGAMNGSIDSATAQER